MSRRTQLLFIALILLLASITSAAAQTIVFEETFSRQIGEPVTTYTNFAGVSGRAIIMLYNGGTEHSATQLVSAASIRLNGSIVFDVEQFNQKMTYLEKAVEMGPDSEVGQEAKRFIDMMK